MFFVFGAFFKKVKKSIFLYFLIFFFLSIALSFPLLTFHSSYTYIVLCIRFLTQGVLLSYG